MAKYTDLLIDAHTRERITDMIDTTHHPELAELDTYINSMDPDIYHAELEQINQALGDYPLVWAAMFEDGAPENGDVLASQSRSALEDMRRIVAGLPLEGQRYG